MWGVADKKILYICPITKHKNNHEKPTFFQTSRSARVHYD